MSQTHPVERELRQMLLEINIREISLDPNNMQKAVDILRLAQAGGMTQVALMTEDVIEAGSRAGVYIPVTGREKNRRPLRTPFKPLCLSLLIVLCFSVLGLFKQHFDSKGLKAQQRTLQIEKEELELALSIARSKG